MEIQTIGSWTLSGTDLLIEASYIDFKDAKEVLGRSPRTLQNYDVFIKPFVEFCVSNKIEPTDITARVVRSFLALVKKRGTIGDSTLASYARNIRTFVRWLFQEEYMAREIKVEIPKVPKKQQLVLNEDQVLKLLIACNGHPHTLRNRALILMAVESGLRREISGIIGHNLPYSRRPYRPWLSAPPTPHTPHHVGVQWVVTDWLVPFN